MAPSRIMANDVDLIDPETEIVGKSLPSLKLTPAMREQIKKGLPYFAGAPVGFGMMQPQDEQR